MNPDRRHPPYCMPKLPLASFSNEFKCDKCFRSRLPIQSGTTFPKSFSQCRISNVTLNEGYFMAIQAKNQLSWWAVHACTNPSLEIISHLMHFSFPQSLLCLLIKKKKMKNASHSCICNVNEKNAPMGCIFSAKYVRLKIIFSTNFPTLSPNVLSL